MIFFPQPLQYFCKDSQTGVMFANFTHQHTFHHESNSELQLHQINPLSKHGYNVQ